MTYTDDARYCAHVADGRRCDGLESSHRAGNFDHAFTAPGTRPESPVHSSRPENVDPMYAGKDRPERPGPTPDGAVFCGYAGEIVRDLDATTEADPVAVLAHLLPAYGAMIGDRAHVQVGNDRHPALLWPLVFGATSAGRKGAARSTAMVIVRAANPEFHDAKIVAGLSSGEGLITEVADDEDDPDSHDKRRVVIESEYGITMARARREGNSLAGVLRQAWDGDNLRVMTKTRLIATRPHIAIIAHVTPREFRARMADAELAAGSYNRLLPIYSHRNVLLPLSDGAAEQTVRRHAQRWQEAVLHGSQTDRVTMTQAARKLWTAELYPELSGDSAEGPIGEFTARAAAYCLRVALVYALMNGEAVISEQTLRAAHALICYSRESVRYVLGDATGTGNPRLDRLALAVRDAGPGGLRKSDVTSMFSKLSRPDRDELIGELVKLPGYALGSRPTGGRSAEVITYADPDMPTTDRRVRQALAVADRLAESERTPFWKA